jgi:hypothetical protein
MPALPIERRPHGSKSRSQKDTAELLAFVPSAAAASARAAAIEIAAPLAHGNRADTANSQAPIAGPAASLRSETTENAA